MTPLWTALEDPQGSRALLSRFPSPFDELGPSALAQRAAAMLQSELAGSSTQRRCHASQRPTFGDPGLAGFAAPADGKMFGVLVVETPAGELGFLRAFSGTIDGRFELPGFVPPIFDAERFPMEEAGEKVVKRLTSRAREFAASDPVVDLRAAAQEMRTRHAVESDALRERHAAHRGRRRQRRAQIAQLSLTDPAQAELHDLAQQSRRDKAERRDIEAAHQEQRRAVEAQCATIDRRLAAHSRLHRMVSRRLMRQIHDTYRVTNALGETRALRALYAPVEPPGGAGDCAAPKLLAYAYAHGFKPLALAEFWWGAPPPGGGRVSGEFYPACREKCGPLLPFMLEGLDVAPPHRFTRRRSSNLDLPVVFEDEWIVVVDKPCGLLSVPARGDQDGDSVFARLRERYGRDVLMVHRLDLDTSGLLVAARDAATHKTLQRQFLRRAVEKRYVAIVERDVTGSGTIELAMRVDVNDRPRQIHDPVHGRAAVTEWRGDGTRIELFPKTGRTHQLRVHAAHSLGLDAPIVGDRLYGHRGERLMLHAESLTFVHPGSGQRVTFESRAPF